MQIVLDLEYINVWHSTLEFQSPKAKVAGQIATWEPARPNFD